MRSWPFLIRRKWNRSMRESRGALFCMRLRDRGSDRADRSLRQAAGKIPTSRKSGETWGTRHALRDNGSSCMTRSRQPRLSVPADVGSLTAPSARFGMTWIWGGASSDTSQYQVQKAKDRSVRPTHLPPDQIHGRVVIVECDLQSFDVAFGEGAGDGFGEIDGFVGGLSSHADHMSPHWNLEGVGVDAIDSI